MYKVVLVDDEELIIEGMKRLIPWEELGCLIAGVAYDGDEALDMVNEVEPDIIITDIRMPEMNGLEMIDYIKEQFPEVIIMILSGYSDFSYAQQALKKGASSYMLKPVSEMELRKEIELATEKLDQRRNQIDKDNVIITRLHHMKRGAKENFLRRMLLEQISEWYMKQMWGSLELAQWKKYVRIAYLDMDEFPGESEMSVVKYAVDNVIEEMCSKCGHIESVSLGNENSALLIMSEYKEINKADMELMDDILKAIEQVCRVKLSAGISCAHAFPQGVPIAFEEAKKALEQRFYEGNGLWIYCEDIEVGNVSYKDLREWEEKLLEAVRSGDKKLATLCIGKFRHLTLQAARLKPEEVYSRIEQLLNRYQDILMEYQIDDTEFQGISDFRHMIRQFKTGTELIRWLESITNRIIRECSQGPEELFDVIERIKRYIERNYQTVNRKETAEHFFMNQSYLSQLFKAETGELFTEYVTKVRMEEAKKLLETTDYKIQYIAELIGYTSNQHFTRTFKKYTGILPVEYKKQHLTKSQKE